MLNTLNEDSCVVHSFTLKSVIYHCCRQSKMLLNMWLRLFMTRLP